MATLIRNTSERDDSAVKVRVDRHKLYKRRWRATADNGVELAANLEVPVSHGEYLSAMGHGCYVVDQLPEDVLVIPLPRKTEMAAKVGWYLGNQHLPVEIREEEILLEYLPTLVVSLDRIGIPHTRRSDVFRCKMHSSHHHTS